MSIYIQVFDLSRPMRWKTFLRLPEKKQIEYLDNLKDQGFRHKQIAEMFRVSDCAIQYHIRRLGLDYTEADRHKDPSLKRRFRDWLLKTPSDEDTKTIDRLNRIVPEWEADWA